MALEDSNSSLLIGSQHIRLSRVDSTNKFATDYISKSNPIEGTVISASYQYAGRGQIGRFWESEDGMNITCSTILQPTFLLAQDQFRLNIAVSLAVFDFVDHFLDDQRDKVYIKWPNDIYVNDEKIAGILIQNTLKGRQINSTVIGTGININQREFSEDVPNPTSIAKKLHSEVDLDLAFSWLFRFLTKRYLQLSAGLIDQMRSEYLKYLYRKDIWSDFFAENDSIFRGKIVGVDKIGQLKIEMEDGIVLPYAFRGVRFII